MSGLDSPRVEQVDLVDQLVAGRMLTVDKPKPKKPRRCHQCHTPLDDQVHNGVKYGVGVCTLPHWSGCEGDIPAGEEAKGKIWAACPDSDAAKISEGPDTEEEEGSKTTSSSDPEAETVAANATKKILTMQEAAEAMENAIQNPESILGTDRVTTLQQKTSGTKPGDSSSSSDGEIRLKRQQVQQLQVQAKEREVALVRATEKEAEEARKERKKQRRLRREQELADLDKQAELLKATASRTRSKVTRSAASPLVSAASNSHSTMAEPVSMTSNGTRNKTLQDQVSEHEARRQRKAADKLAKQRKTRTSELTMPGIRELPDVQEEAAVLMAKLQSMIPSLAKDPTAKISSGGTFRRDDIPAGHKTGQEVSQAGNGSRYVYVASLGQAIPVVDTPADLSASSQLRACPEISETDSEETCSADEACPFSPEPGKRFAWRRNPDGSKYFTAVVAASPVLVWTYVLDRKTGRYERRQVPAQTGSLQPKSRQSANKQQGISPSYRDHRVHSAGWTGQGQSQTRRGERQPSYVCPDAHGDKEGKETRVPQLVKYARECPVSWTSKVTTDKLNPILWSWAYVAELLATRTGHAPVLPEGEMEARLQHFLSVLEVLLQTTIQTDFLSDAWKVARLYHVKVQQKIDSGDNSWVQMLQQWGSATLPHELMAAKAEVQFKPKGTNVGLGNGGTKGDSIKGGKKDPEKKLMLCSGWNNCETRGKCRWETDHEGESCNRVHACSWCKSKDLKPLTHQKRFCRRRIEEEGE